MHEDITTDDPRHDEKLTTLEDTERDYRQLAHMHRAEARAKDKAAILPHLIRARRRHARMVATMQRVNLIMRQCRFDGERRYRGPRHRPVCRRQTRSIGCRTKSRPSAKAGSSIGGDPDPDSRAAQGGAL